MKIVVLVNAAAGPSASRAAANRVELVRQGFAALGVQARIEAVAPRDLPTAAARAARSDAEVVVAAGGDGTVSTVARALLEVHKPLGILPLGTLNHFAKDLKVPLDLQAAMEAVVRGSVRRVDVAEVNGISFINNSSIGIYPAMVRDREEQRLQFGLSKPTAMLLAAMRVLRRFPLLRVRLETDDRALARKTPFVFVGNNRYEINLLSLGARERIDRGELSLYVANCQSRLALVRLIFRVFFGTLVGSRDFEAAYPPRCWVETRKRRLAVALDGEVLRLKPPLAYRSRPAALAVMLPAEVTS